MVSSVNRSSGVNNSGGSLPLIPPSELYKTTTTTRPTYSQDGVLKGDIGAGISQASQFGIGALSGYKYQETVVGSSQAFGNSILKGSFHEVLGSMRDQSKIVGVSAANAAGVGALLSGSLSTVSNTISFASGRESFRSAGADVVTDTIKGAISGVGGLTVGGMSALALTTLKFTGTPVVVASVLGGAIGASLFNKFFNVEGIRTALKGN